jgi:hypothetical protein
MTIDPDIASLDLDAVAYKLHLDQGWGLKPIDRAIADYRIFLQAVRHRGSEMVPSRRVDAVWHHHILDTEKYMADCARLFGGYVHHYPYSGLFGEADAARQHARFERSLAVYEEIRRSTGGTPTKQRRG